MPPVDPSTAARSATALQPAVEPHADPAALRAEHATWNDWISRWRDDVSRWQAEHDDAIERLARVQDAVRVHGASLAAHAAAFTAVESAIASHEHLLATTPPADSGTVVDAHATQRSLLRQQREAHERIARHHAAVLAQLATLEASAAAPL